MANPPSLAPPPPQPRPDPSDLLALRRAHFPTKTARDGPFATLWWPEQYDPPSPATIAPTKNDIFPAREPESALKLIPRHLQLHALPSSLQRATTGSTHPAPNFQPQVASAQYAVGVANPHPQVVVSPQVVHAPVVNVAPPQYSLLPATPIQAIYSASPLSHSHSSLPSPYTNTTPLQSPLKRKEPPTSPSPRPRPPPTPSTPSSAPSGPARSKHFDFTAAATLLRKLESTPWPTHHDQPSFTAFLVSLAPALVTEAALPRIFALQLWLRGLVAFNGAVGRVYDTFRVHVVREYVRLFGGMPRAEVCPKAQVVPPSMGGGVGGGAGAAGVGLGVGSGGQEVVEEAAVEVVVGGSSTVCATESMESL